MCAIPFVIVAGKLSDKVSAKILVPGGLIFQSIVFTLYCFVPNPTSWTAYALAVPQAGTVMIVIVTMQSYVSKRCPKNIRGMIFAVIGIFSALGCVSYLQTYNLLDNIFGPSMAFGTIVLFDVVWLIVLLIFIAIGKYGNPAPGTDENEDQEALDVMGPIDAPIDPSQINKEIEFEEKNQTPYDAKMLDPDEEYERSSRRGSFAAKVVKKHKTRGSLNE